MTKKTTPSHTEAKKYLDTYTGKIREKFLDQKKEKALFELLKISPEKQEEEKRKMKEDMKKFVQELQSDKNYATMKKIYHEQMKNIHGFNRLIHDYTQELQKPQMKEHMKLAKEKFFNENIGVWKNFVKTFKKKWNSLTPQQQQKAFEDMDKLMNDPSAFQQFIKKTKEFIHWYPVTTIFWLSILFAPLLTWSIIAYKDTNELFAWWLFVVLFFDVFMIIFSGIASHHERKEQKMINKMINVDF